MISGLCRNGRSTGSVPLPRSSCDCSHRLLERQALRDAVSNGQLDPQAASGLRCLTSRESAILQLIYAGLRDREIASALNLKPRTVKGYVSKLLARFDASNRTELIGCAIDLGHLEPRKTSGAALPAPTSPAMEQNGRRTSCE